MIKSLTLTNFLSYGASPCPIELRSLNVLIGPNGSGKSNLIEALELLSEGLIGANHQTGGPDQWLPWEHLRQRDRWEMPSDSCEMDCHLMVQVMESWFLADRETLQAFFGQGFQVGVLPHVSHAVERVSKDTILSTLHAATAKCKTKASYGKGAHSFSLLAQVNPARVTDASPWAKRFVEALKKRTGE